MIKNTITSAGGTCLLKSPFFQTVQDSWSGGEDFSTGCLAYWLYKNEGIPFRKGKKTKAQGN